MSDLKAVANPPELTRRNWSEIAQKARQVAPEWVVVEDVPASTATRIRQGKMSSFPAPSDWDITTRNNTRNNRCTLFIRHTGA